MYHISLHRKNGGTYYIRLKDWDAVIEWLRLWSGPISQNGAPAKLKRVIGINCGIGARDRGERFLRKIVGLKEAGYE